jgi:quinol monooxygenase YgiN
MDMFIFGRFHARPGSEAKVAKTLIDVVAPTSAEPGCISINAFRSTEDPQLFFIHTHWKDAQAFERHITLPHTVHFVECMTPLIDNPLELSRTEKIS